MNLGEAMVEETPAGTSGSIDKGSSDNGEREISRVEIEPSHNGGFVVKEYYKQGKKGDMSYMEPTTKTASDLKGLDELLDNCFGMSGAYDSDNG